MPSQSPGSLIYMVAAVAPALVIGACCPVAGGATAVAVTHSAMLQPGELRYFDVETPVSTSQINLTFRIETTDAPLQLRQIDPACEPAGQDTCRTFYDAILAARPAGVTRFGNTLQPHGARTRIVLRNLSEDRTISVSLTIVPYRAGCT